MNERIEKLIRESEDGLSAAFRRLDDIAFYNQKKVLEAFLNNRVAAMHFLPSTGYGYGDAGRETLGKVYAGAFGAEAGVV